MIQPLQGMRFFFAVFVLLSHYGGDTWGRLYAGGNVGVSYFFMLSGFVLALGYRDRLLDGSMDCRGFWRRRCSKIFLPHWLCLIATLLSCPWTLTTLHELWPSFFLLQSWFPTRGVALGGNTPSWFLSTMLFLYFLFPLIARPLLGGTWRRGVAVVTVALVLYIALAAWLLPVGDNDADAQLIELWLYVFPPSRLIDFVFGIELYRLYEYLRGRVSPGVKIATVIEALAVMLVVASVPVFYMVGERWNTALLFFVPTALLIAVMSLTAGRPGVVSRFFSSRVMLWLGALSFEFYLVHLTVMYVLDQVYRKLDVSVSYITGLVILVALSIAGALALKYVVALSHRVVHSAVRGKADSMRH